MVLSSYIQGGNKDEEAKKRMGPVEQVSLMRSGAVPLGALSAMRRNVMRELLPQKDDAVSE